MQYQIPAWAGVHGELLPQPPALTQPGHSALPRVLALWPSCIVPALVQFGFFV